MTTKIPNLALRCMFICIGAFSLILIIVNHVATASPNVGQNISTPPDFDTVGVNEPGVVVEPARVNSDQSIEPRLPDSPTALPNIDMWYGETQNFGNPGNPQRWADILGRVTIGTISSLTYSLNDGESKPLNIGPDGKRLQGKGDFHIELPIADLQDGSNTVKISATNEIGTTTQIVTVNYSPGFTWPKNTIVDWSSSTNVQDVVRVVDGLWRIDNGSLRPSEVGYDRLVAIGDMSWTDYEVTVPVTIFGVSRDLAGIGMILRWNGYRQIEDEQPNGDWTDLGALVWNRWRPKEGQIISSLQMIGRGGSTVANNDKRYMEIGIPYFMKASVQTIEDSRYVYRFKVWEQADPEPIQWDVQYTTEPDPQELSNGSILLLAHQVDAKFGNVKVESLNGKDFTLDVTTEGNGTVSIDPQKPKYAYGEQVTLTANPVAGNLLGRWSGALRGQKNPISFAMTQNADITAVFVEEKYANLNINISGQGSVETDPAKSSYVIGEEVILRASPSFGYRFAEWTGDLTGNSSIENIIIAGDTNITAVFESVSDSSIPASDDFTRCELDNGKWVKFDPVGDATFNMTGTNLEISVPAGVNHNLWMVPGRIENRAPRVFTPAENTDFEIEVKFNSRPSERYQLQGILIQQDSDNFMRFDFNSDGVVTRTFAAAFVDGFAVWTGSRDLVDEDEYYMRVRRQGNNWIQSYSYDGVTWIQGITHQRPYNISAVGLFAGNFGPNPPQFTASIDYVFNTAAPIVPQDGEGLQVEVDINGLGSVNYSPQKDYYSCGETVNFTAVPSSGWLFNGWGGGLTGSTNPISIQLAGNLSVLAEFIPDSPVEKYENYLPFTTDN